MPGKRREHGTDDPDEQDATEEKEKRARQEGAEEPIERTLREGPPPAEDDRSEDKDAPRAVQPESLRNWNRDELLERAAEQGLNVDPSISREGLIEKLSRNRERS